LTTSIGAKLGDRTGEARVRHNVDDPLDVLVGERRFLGQPSVRRAADDDALSLELPSELAPWICRVAA
jgi:hypothetical protein